MDKIDKAYQAIRKRKEQLAFDAQTPERQKQLRDSGLDPYEPECIRKIKQDNVRAELARMIEKVPEEDKQMLIRYGYHPFSKKDEVVYG